MTPDDAFWADAAATRHRALGAGLAREGGLSDRQIACEAQAQAIFFPALAGFQSRLRQAAALSVLMEKDFRRLLDAIDDHAPARSYWDERIERP